MYIGLQPWRKEDRFERGGKVPAGSKKGEKKKSLFCEQSKSHSRARGRPQRHLWVSHRAFKTPMDIFCSTANTSKVWHAYRDVIEPGLELAGSQARTLFCQPALTRAQACKPGFLTKEGKILVKVVKKN